MIVLLVLWENFIVFMHSPSREINYVSCILESIYADVWAPAFDLSIEGHLYFVNFMDAYSKFNWGFSIFRKSEICRLSFYEIP